MAREGISYESVSAAAEALVAEGASPTIRAIRDALGTGSPNTIHRHLANWRASRPAPKSEAPRLPDELTGALVQALDRAAAAAKSDVERRLVEALDETRELATAGEALEVERDELAELAAGLRSELERQGGEIEALRKSIADLEAELTRERASAEASRLEAAKASLKAESHVERIGELSAEIAEVRSRAEREAEALRSNMERERAERFQAEQRAAVLETRVEAAQKAQEAAEARGKEREGESDKRARAAAQAARDAQSQAAAEKARADALEKLLPSRKPVAVTASVDQPELAVESPQKRPARGQK